MALLLLGLYFVIFAFFRMIISKLLVLLHRILGDKDPFMFKKILIAILFFPAVLQAQKKHHEIGIFGGTSSYYGDLQQNLFPGEGYRAAGGLVYKYFMHPNVGFRSSINYASLYGSDSLSKIPAIRERNLDFETNVLEVAVGLEANLLPIDVDEYKVSPYVFAQIGLFYFNPYILDENSEKLYLRPLGTEGQGLDQYPERTPYSLVNVAFPLGAGVKFLIGKKVFLNVEMGFRYTSTDYLDDVSKSYVNLDNFGENIKSVNYSFRSDELPTWDGNYPNEGFHRGDDTRNDWYWFGGVSLSIYFDSFGNPFKHKQSRCPRGVSSSK